jgi:hypothetical protein
MDDIMTPETTDNGAKEPRTIKLQMGSGPEWNAPVSIIRALLTSAWAENPVFMGRHLLAAMTGELPTRAGRRRNGDGGEQ